jgi:hypothetical protein
LDSAYGGDHLRKDRGGVQAWDGIEVETYDHRPITIKAKVQVGEPIQARREEACADQQHHAQPGLKGQKEGPKP